MLSPQVSTGRNLPVTIEFTIELKDGMLDTEDAIQRGVNQAGVVATQYALSQYDTDGTPIM